MITLLLTGEIDAAYQLFADASLVDLSLLMGGKSTAAKATSVMDIATARKDCVAFISPERADVVGVANAITQTKNVKDFFNALPSTSYAVFDSGYKYMYDRYSDVYRFVPLNGDIAGSLCSYR